MKQFKGIVAALPTPFDSTGAINHAAIKRQVRRLIDQQIDGFYVCGSTGEAFLMSADERKSVLETVCEENNGEKLVIAHVGQISTDAAIELGHHAKSLNVDAISSISPFYYKFSKEEIKYHYLELMNSVQIPFFVYNFPANTGFSMTSELLDEMSQSPYLKGVKFTSTDFFQLERMKRSHPELTIWNGYDEMLVSGLSAGADGGIGSTYNVLCPAIRKIYDSFQEGNIQEAMRYQHIANDMIEVMVRSGAATKATKYILESEGIEFGDCRKPFSPLDESAKESLLAAYAQFKKEMDL